MIAPDVAESVAGLTAWAHLAIHASGSHGRMVRNSLAPVAQAKRRREMARSILLALEPCRIPVGARAVDSLVGEVEILAHWPISAGARGWPYVVRAIQDGGTYIATDSQLTERVLIGHEA